MLKVFIGSVFFLGLFVGGSAGAIDTNQSGGDFLTNFVKAAAADNAQNNCANIKADNDFKTAKKDFDSNCQLGTDGCLSAAVICTKCETADASNVSYCPSAGEVAKTSSASRNNKNAKAPAQYLGVSAAQLKDYMMCPFQSAQGSDRLQKIISDEQSRIDTLKDKLRTAQEKQLKIEKDMSDRQAKYQEDVDKENERHENADKAQDRQKQADLDKANQAIRDLTNQITKEQTSLLDIANKERQALDKTEQQCFQEGQQAILNMMKARSAAIATATLTSSSFNSLFDGAGESRQQKNQDLGEKYYQACMTRESTLEQFNEIRHEANADVIKVNAQINADNQQLKALQTQAQQIPRNAQTDQTDEANKNKKNLLALYNNYKTATDNDQKELNQLVGSSGAQGTDALKALVKQQAIQEAGSHSSISASLDGKDFNNPNSKVGLDSEIGQINSEIQGRQAALDSAIAASAVAGDIPADKAKAFMSSISPLSSASADLLPYCYALGVITPIPDSVDQKNLPKVSADCNKGSPDLGDCQAAQMASNCLNPAADDKSASQCTPLQNRKSSDANATTTQINGSDGSTGGKRR